MKYLRYLGIALLLGALGYGAILINTQNYIALKALEEQKIGHPELIPEAQYAKLSSFGFQNVMADMYWLRTVQYIGGNVISEEYRKYLFAMLDLITEMNPYFESPYTIGMLLLPSDDYRGQLTLTDEEKGYTSQGEKLGLKGIQNFCNIEKISAIKNEDDLEKVMNDPLYHNPCQSYKIPYYLAYIYYFYLNDGLESAKYYKVVSAQDDAPTGARVLAAIMQGKGGEREKSLYMFLSLAKSVAEPDEDCSVFSQELENTYTLLSQNNLPLTGELIQNIEILRNKLLPALTQENEDMVLDDTECTNYLAKATREINLMYLDTANEAFKESTGNPAQDPEELFDAGYISFIPTDYQQYEDYGIIYSWSDDFGRFDYQMGAPQK